ncbi:hypothetical protein EOB49_25100 [Mesorhizobium sp. M7A.F.Ca.MR.148.00.0.0]|nr:hypothetical protein EOB49_25100 [Mesorhizobium sp. M7A.F.Ca.MR.148.00.0.0]
MQIGNSHSNPAAVSHPSGCTLVLCLTGWFQTGWSSLCSRSNPPEGRQQPGKQLRKASRGRGTQPSSDDPPSDEGREQYVQIRLSDIDHARREDRSDVAWSIEPLRRSSR